MKLNYDKSLDIATGTSRKTKTWKNAPIRWSELLERLSTPVRTPETMAEYKAMSTARQSDVKDVGGFVGGYCNNGRRADVRFRSLLCLDADFASSDLWEDWCLIYGNAAAIYSTHKHTPKAPRLRLVIPLRRNVDPEEYEALGRRVAERLGIDQFDDTSYQPQRLMFWPSCSHDGEYVFERLDAEYLDPDAVLSTYVDWRDVSSWPMSSRQADVTKPNGKSRKTPPRRAVLSAPSAGLTASRMP